MSEYSTRTKLLNLPLWALLAAGITGCATNPPAPAHPAPRPAPAVAPTPPAPVTEAVPAPAPVRTAWVKGSEETSTLLDNFTAFVAAIDGQPVPAGRKGWNVPLEIRAGHRLLAVEFNRGVFVARATVELEADADAHYEVRYATDAQLFGNNSFCEFWIVDTGTNKTVTPIKKTPVHRNQ